MDVLEALHQAHRQPDCSPRHQAVKHSGHCRRTGVATGFRYLQAARSGEALPGAATLTRTGIALLTPGGTGSPEQHAGEPITQRLRTSTRSAWSPTKWSPANGHSTAPASLGDAAAIPPSRAMGQNAEQRKVAGDLDAIICKALHDEATRRYGSALDMRDDLQRLSRSPGRCWHARTLWAIASSSLPAADLWLVPLVVLGCLAIAGYMTTITLYSRQLEFEKRRALAAETFMVDLLESPDPFCAGRPRAGQLDHRCRSPRSRR